MKVGFIRALIAGNFSTKFFKDAVFLQDQSTSKMISTGQLVFAICFFIAFVIIVAISYRKDKKLHKKYYKGNVWVLVGFVIFFLILLAAKFLLKE